MPIKPGKNESQDDWMARCMHEMSQNEDRTNEQNVAICLDIWNNKDKTMPTPRRQVKQPDPNDYDDRDEFMSDCVQEGEDEDTCAMIWQERSGAGGVIRKVHTGEVNGLEFVLSDETPDRLDDVISADGWDLANFKRNPIALFGHDSSFPIGKWNNVRIENKELRGHLELAPDGTSPRLDEIIRLVRAGILRAVSVGFRPSEYKAREASKVGGLHYTRSELVETSLVSVPANPNALAVAKRLHISPATIDVVFAKHGNRDGARRRGVSAGKHANLDIDRVKRGTTMLSINQNIQDTQTRLIGAQDALEDHVANFDPTDATEADMDRTNELTAQVGKYEKMLRSLQSAEAAMAKTIEGVALSQHSRALTVIATGKRQEEEPQTTSPFVIRGGRKPEPKPIELLAKAFTVALLARALQRPHEAIMAQHYKDDTLVKAMVGRLVIRAPSAPAMTDVPGWAQELVQPIYTDLMPTLLPDAVYTLLRGYGMGLSFGRAGRIVMPTRISLPTPAISGPLPGVTTPPMIHGSFVGEGQAIPVRQGQFTSQELTPKKMAVITPWTREISEHSTPAIEGLLRQAVTEDTTFALDSVLVSAAPATGIAPAGLLNPLTTILGSGAVPIAAEAGIGTVRFDMLTSDIRRLTGALIRLRWGQLGRPVWIMNPRQVNDAKLIPSSTGDTFPWAAELNGGNLNGFPVISSGAVVDGQMILVDATDFVSVNGEDWRFEVSDQATLHMEDTDPLEIVDDAGAVAQPVRSLWQTDSLALRLIIPLNWLVRRRPGSVVFRGTAATPVAWSPALT